MTAVVFVIAAYVAVVLIVGRFLAFHGVLPRPQAEPKDLAGLPLEDIAFSSPDGITLRGWFIPCEGNPSGRTLNSPGGLFIKDNRMVVADQANHRVLIFEGEAQ